MSYSHRGFASHQVLNCGIRVDPVFANNKSIAFCLFTLLVILGISIQFESAVTLYAAINKVNWSHVMAPTASVPPTNPVTDLTQMSSSVFHLSL